MITCQSYLHVRVHGFYCREFWLTAWRPLCTMGILCGEAGQSAKRQRGGKGAHLRQGSTANLQGLQDRD